MPGIKNSTDRVLTLLALYYLFIPLAVFLLSWTKPWIGLPLFALSVPVPFLLTRGISGDNVTGTRKQEIILLIVITAWVIISGVGGYMWQNRWDHMFRNAVFSDLVSRPWPVTDGDSILVYYLGYWLMPALSAKVAGNIEVGYALQTLYGIAGMLIAFRFVLNYVGNVRLRYLLPFIFFSGLDLAGLFFSGVPIRGDFHFELWSPLAFWSSNTTLLFWVYNQAIPSWVATMLILAHGRRPGFAAITLAFTTISAPFSVVGLFPLAAYYILSEAFSKKTARQTLGTIFSWGNLLSVIIAAPVILYFSFNAGTTSGFIKVDSFGGLVVDLILLFIFEIGIFLPFIFRYIKRSPEFYILLATSLLCLFLKVGSSLDFGSRVELPLNYFLTLQIILLLRDWKSLSGLRRKIFIAISVIAVMTPCAEIARVMVASLLLPVETYRSFTVPTIFQQEKFRHNFVVDSVSANSHEHLLNTVFNYPDKEKRLSETAR